MIYPMFLVVTLTFLVGCVTLRTRFKSVYDKQVSPRYYVLMQGQNVPEAVTKTTRCFNNLFEAPTLFYAAGCLYVALDIENTLSLIAAWGFVIFRIIQAAIHLTYNNLIHRMLSYWTGFICIIVLWLNLIVHAQ